MPRTSVINFNKKFTITPTITTTQYTAGDSVGGLLTIDNNAIPNGGAAYIEAISIADKQAGNTQIDVIVFNENPSSSTITDNDPVSIHSDDLSKVIGLQSISTSDYFSVGTPSIAYNSLFSIPLVSIPTSRAVYATLVERGTPTRAVGDLIVTFHTVWLGS